MGLYTWEELKNFVDHCSRCDLCRHRKMPVMGRGDLKSRIMFVAEAPGRMEDEQGIPFVGRSGVIILLVLEESRFILPISINAILRGTVTLRRQNSRLVCSI